MGWLFGRKSAAPDARPFVPAWLCSDTAEEGFARSFEGLNAYVKLSGTWANYRSGAWEIGTVRGASVVLDGVQVIGPRLAAISAPTGGTNVDAQGRVSISQILAALRQHGLIET